MRTRTSTERNEKKEEKDQRGGKIETNKELKDTITDKDVFDDIDLFTLRGIRKITSPSSYPYIKIDGVEKIKRKVVYKFSSKDSVARKDNRFGLRRHVRKKELSFA